MQRDFSDVIKDWRAKAESHLAQRPLGDELDEELTPARQEVLASDLARVRIEMNLLEFPVCAYSPHQARHAESLVVRRQLADGNLIIWELLGTSKEGLPQPGDLDKLLVILDEAQHWVKSNGDEGRKFPLSFSAICDRLEVDRSGRNYQLLRASIARLHGATIRSQRAFYDAKKRERITFERGSHILDDYNIVERRPRKGTTQLSFALSSITLSEFVYENIREEYVKAIDFAVYRQLGSHLAKVLYCHLAKMLGTKGSLSYGLEKLRANIGYPLSPSNPRRTYRELLDALYELGNHGMLGDVQTDGSGANALVILKAAQVAQKRKPSGIVA